MKIRLFSLMPLLLFLCGCHQDERFFGAKLYAIYRNCDSAARILNKPAPKKSGSRPETEAYLQLFLALAEMHRGQLDEMHRAFVKAGNPAPRPELLLLRGEWYIRNGEADKAKKDFDALEKLLAKEDFSRRFTYYLYLAAKDGPYNDEEWKKVRDGSFYQTWLKERLTQARKKLEVLEKTPGTGILELRKFADPRFRKIRFGMAQEELQTLLGPPRFVRNITPVGMLSQVALVYFTEKYVAGFLFSPEKRTLGDCVTASVCPLHGPEKMRQLRTGKTGFDGKLPPPDAEFIYTTERKPFFRWACVECAKEARKQKKTSR